MSRGRRKEMVEPEHSELTITRQCELLQIGRSSWYYKALGESELNLQLMKLIDEQFLETPYYGARQMARYLRRQGHWLNQKRVQLLMTKMGLMAMRNMSTTLRHSLSTFSVFFLQSRSGKTGQ